MAASSISLLKECQPSGSSTGQSLKFKRSTGISRSGDRIHSSIIIQFLPHSRDQGIWCKFSISWYLCILFPLVYFQYILAYSASCREPKVAVYPGISSGCLSRPTIYTFLPLSSCQNQISARPHNLIVKIPLFIGPR